MMKNIQKDLLKNKITALHFSAIDYFIANHYSTVHIHKDLLILFYFKFNEK